MAVRKPPRERQVPSPALTQVIYEGLRKEITTGRLKPGEALSRRRIAQRYGSSYATVIQALVRLQDVGLVEAESSQMARVRPISVEIIQDTYVLREALETQAILLACELAAPEEIDDLFHRAKQVDACAAKRDRRPHPVDPQGPLLHWEFHKRIAVLSRSPGLLRELERLEIVRRFQANWLYLPDMVDPPHYHSLLVDPIKDRNPQAAVAAMRGHVRKGLEKELKGYRLKMCD
ncbi:hypothetical protein AYO44_16650 [Planctomycetaceae bacterium SCGC AG-212-F19]|nr:hypothetical protein AYO44_16650 [Planctomycetaceae bacterium SCGC AG-212-F19]